MKGIAVIIISAVLLTVSFSSSYAGGITSELMSDKSEVSTKTKLAWSELGFFSGVFIGGYLGAIASSTITSDWSKPSPRGFALGAGLGGITGAILGWKAAKENKEALKTTILVSGGILSGLLLVGAGVSALLNP